MVKTIALPEDVYEELSALKKESGAETYGELVKMLIDVYRRFRVQVLKEVIGRLKLPEEEAVKVERAVSEVKGRRWWS